MKIIKLLIPAILIFFIACKPQKETSPKTQEDASTIASKKTNTEKPEFNFLIKNQQIGNLTIGMQAEDLLKKVSGHFSVDRDSIDACGGCNTYVPILNIRQNDMSLFSAEPDIENNGAIFRFVVFSKDFKTDTGIRIGDTYKKLQQNCEITGVNINPETGIHVFVKGFDGSFEMKMPPNDEWQNLNSENLPEDIEISRIIII